MKQFVLSGELTVEDGRVTLDGKDYHYLVRVRRHKPGDSLQVLWKGEVAQARIVKVGETALELVLEGLAVPAQREARELYLFPGLLKGSKIDEVLKHGVECGAFGIYPFGADHSISKIEPAEVLRKLGRWKTLVQEGVQQSGSPLVPEVRYFPNLGEILKYWSDRGTLLFFHQTPLEKETLHGYLSRDAGPVGLIIGPEGGFSQGELGLLTAGGARPVWLGQRVLRAETASLYALAAVRTIIEEKDSWTIP